MFDPDRVVPLRALDFDRDTPLDLASPGLTADLRAGIAAWRELGRVCRLEGCPDELAAEATDDRVNGRRPKRWRNQPDQPLGHVLERMKQRNEDT